MIPTIKLQNTMLPYQNRVDREKTETVAGTDFSKTLSKVTESVQKKSQVDNSMSSDMSRVTRADILSIIQDKIRELQDQLENGETEPTYQIGSKALTKKEWDNLIYKVDNALEKDEKKAENESEEENANAINPKDKEKIA